MRLIDADALMDLYANRLELLGERYWPDSSECGVLSGAMKLLEAQPTIEERKAGKAIVKSTGYRGYWACDQCGTEIKCTDNFCRHCGADLRGELK